MQLDADSWAAVQYWWHLISPVGEMKTKIIQVSTGSCAVSSEWSPVKSEDSTATQDWHRLRANLTRRWPRSWLAPRCGERCPIHCVSVLSSKATEVYGGNSDSPLGTVTKSSGVAVVCDLLSARQHGPVSLVSSWNLPSFVPTAFPPFLRSWWVKCMNPIYKTLRGPVWTVVLTMI